MTIPFYSPDPSYHHLPLDCCHGPFMGHPTFTLCSFHYGQNDIFKIKISKKPHPANPSPTSSDWSHPPIAPRTKNKILKMAAEVMHRDPNHVLQLLFNYLFSSNIISSAYWLIPRLYLLKPTSRI